MVAALITFPLFGIMALGNSEDAFGLFEGERGSRAFYSAAAQAIPTIVVAWIIEMRVFLHQLRRVVTVDSFGMILLAGNIWIIGGGEWYALRALNCTAPVCGSPAEFGGVVLALITGGLLLAATTLVAFIADD